MHEKLQPYMGLYERYKSLEDQAGISDEGMTYNRVVSWLESAENVTQLQNVCCSYLRHWTKPTNQTRLTRKFLGEFIEGLSKEDLIESQLADTEDLVKRGVIGAWKLSRSRVFTLITSKERSQGHYFTREDIDNWFDKNRPEIQ